MADRFLLEASAVDGFLLEDGTGVLLLEATAGAADVIFSMLHRIERGMVAQTAAGMGGVIEE